MVVPPLVVMSVQGRGGMFSAVLQLMPSQSFLLGMSSLAVFYAPQARKRRRGKETDKGKICSPLLLLRFPSQTSLPTTPKTIAHVNNTVGRIFCLLFSPRPIQTNSASATIHLDWKEKRREGIEESGGGRSGAKIASLYFAPSEPWSQGEKVGGRLPLSPQV